MLRKLNTMMPLKMAQSHAVKEKYQAFFETFDFVSPSTLKSELGIAEKISVMFKDVKTSEFVRVSDK